MKGDDTDLSIIFIMRIRKNTDQAEEADIELIASVSDALAHPVRLKLFRHIMKANRSMQQVCNGDLVNEFGYAQATISQHMQKLVKAGLVSAKKQNKYTYYYANPGMLMKYIDNTKKYSII